MVLHNCSYSSKSMVLTKKKGRFYDLGRKALCSNAEMGDLSKTAMAHVLLPSVDTSLRKERWFRKYCSYTMLHHCNRTWQWRIPCWFRGDFPIRIGFMDFSGGSSIAIFTARTAASADISWWSETCRKRGGSSPTPKLQKKWTIKNWRRGGDCLSLGRIRNWSGAYSWIFGWERIKPLGNSSPEVGKWSSVIVSGCESWLHVFFCIRPSMTSLWLRYGRFVVLACFSYMFMFNLIANDDQLQWYPPVMFVGL